MKDKILVVGGGSGLGLVLAKLLIKDNSDVHILTRSKPNDYIDFINYHQADLQNLDDLKIKQLVELMQAMNAIVFCQRYRPSNDAQSNKAKRSQDEYKVSVQATAMIIEELTKKLKDNSNKIPIKLLLIGSTYSMYAGYDQDWSYHAVKSALHGIVRYFAIRSNGLYTINMISPPTFIKPGAEEYWKKTDKYQRWENYPSNRLPSAYDVASFAKMILKNSNLFVNGQNIVCDGGTSCLYPDQTICDKPDI